MSWAAKRKILYFSVFIIVVGVLIAVPIYFYITNRQSTCFDGRQDQNEQGVDCGGPCVNLCKPLELAPVVLWQQVFQVTPGVYTAVAYVENPNINGEAFNVPYTFTLADSQNNTLITRSGSTLIPAGKNFSIVETNITLPANQIPVQTSFEFISQLQWVLARMLPALTVSNVISSNSTSSPTISALINNPSLSKVGNTIVMVIVYDTDGNAFAASRTVINSIQPQSSQKIVFTWPLPFKKSIARIEVIPVIQ